MATTTTMATAPSHSPSPSPSLSPSGVTTATVSSLQGVGGIAETPELNAEREAARQYAVADFLDLLPKLGSGLDINVRFDSCQSFEFTRELSVFDVFPRVRLVHGWLVDPQDARLAVALAGLSYNQLVDQLVRTAEPLVDAPLFNPSAPPPEAFNNNNNNNEFALNPPRQINNNIHNLSRVHIHDVRNTYATDETNHNSVSNAVDGSHPPDAELDNDKEEIKYGLDRIINPTAEVLPDMATSSTSLPVPLPTAPPATAAASDAMAPARESAPALGALTELPAPASVSTAPAASSSSQRPAHETIRELRPLVVDFLESNSTQLTVYGLAELHSTLIESEIAILFRNSHFYVIRKHNQHIYTLVTDVGFMNELNTVWEILTDVTGDSTFFNGSFQPIAPDGTVIGATENAASTAHPFYTPPPPSASSQKQGSVFSRPTQNPSSSTGATSSTRKKKPGKKPTCNLQ